MSYTPGRGRGTIRGWSTQAGKLNTDDGLIFGARLRYWAILVAGIVAIFFALSAHAAPTVEPFVGWSHQSDIFTGRPFFSTRPGCEQSADWIGVGVTLAWLRTEVDFGHGVKVRDFWCSASDREHGKSGTLASVRYYFMRGRR